MDSVLIRKFSYVLKYPYIEKMGNVSNGQFRCIHSRYTTIQTFIGFRSMIELAGAWLPDAAWRIRRNFLWFLTANTFPALILILGNPESKATSSILMTGKRPAIDPTLSP